MSRPQGERTRQKHSSFFVRGRGGVVTDEGEGNVVMLAPVPRGLRRPEERRHNRQGPVTEGYGPGTNGIKLLFINELERFSMTFF